MTKASADAAATRRVLADIADAVRPVEHARTAAAVGRVLRTATPALRDSMWGRTFVALAIAEELGIELASDRPCHLNTDCVWCWEPTTFVDDLPGLCGFSSLYKPDVATQRRYAPWVVSPHLFDEGES